MAHVCVHEVGHCGIQAENDGPAPHSRLSAGCGEALNPAVFARVSRRYRPVSVRHVMWSLHTHGLPEALHRESPRSERVCTHSDCTSIEVRNVRRITAIGGLVESISPVLRTAVSVPIFYVFRGNTSLTDPSLLLLPSPFNQDQFGHISGLLHTAHHDQPSREPRACL